MIAAGASRLQRVNVPPWLVPAMVASLPAVLAAGRGLRRSWIPFGDNAYFTVRARDVLTDHHPLVGAWSSGSEAVGIDVNNLGPLQLDLLAPPTRLLGFGPGTIVGVTLVQVLAACVVVWAAGRRAGSVGRWTAAASVVGLSWSLGSDLLLEPRQHHYLLLPFLACLVLAWSLVDGDHALLPWAAFFGSLVVQTHFSFLVPVAVLSLLALVGLGLSMRTSRGSDGAWPARLRPHLVLTGAVLLLAWIQPVVQQLTADRGNLSAVWEVSRAEQRTLGGDLGARMVATVASPLGWLPPTFAEFFPPGGLRSPGVTTLLLALQGAALVGLGVLAWRRADRGTLTALVTGAVALGAVWWSSASTPVSGPFGAMNSSFRPLWPVGAFAAAALVLGLVRALPSRAQLPALAALVLAVGALVTLQVPADYAQPSPRFNAGFQALTRSLRTQLADLEVAGGGPVLIDGEGFLGEPFTYVILGSLQERGLDFVFDNERNVRRFGEGRRFDGQATATLVMRTGPPALEDRPGDRRVAFATWTTPEERAELDRLEAARAVLPLSPKDEARRLELRVGIDRGTVAVWLSEGQGADA